MNARLEQTPKRTPQGMVGMGDVRIVVVKPTLTSIKDSLRKGCAKSLSK